MSELISMERKYLCYFDRNSCLTHYVEECVRQTNQLIGRMNRSAAVHPAGAGMLNSTLLRMKEHQVTKGMGAIITHNQVVFTMSL